MKYKLMLLVAFIGLGLFFYGNMKNLPMYYWSGIALTGSMFLGFMARKFARSKS